MASKLVRQFADALNDLFPQRYIPPFLRRGGVEEIIEQKVVRVGTYPDKKADIWLKTMDKTHGQWLLYHIVSGDIWMHTKPMTDEEFERHGRPAEPRKDGAVV